MGVGGWGVGEVGCWGEQSCLLPFAFCLLPFAFCLLPFAFCLLKINSVLTVLGAKSPHRCRF
ncbi:MAG: hypothetical protein DWQ51_19300 [Microcystis wesenbergii TW10]|uniref:Uncharacterized protein n=1 Tax=Microcystis wesenbergii TW10 TaxID=2060474 RepID=A0A3E0LLP4_9CHRO|nr:MAG: hypothetical protein DWQ51_19300 [Microcystis wesenbergii TW10]